MNTYCYEAVNSEGLSVKGMIEVATQSQALRRIKQMGLFPTRLREKPVAPTPPVAVRRPAVTRYSRRDGVGWVRRGGVDARVLTVFTRQLATLIQAGMPLLRGLRILQQQEENRRLKRVIGEVSRAIEGGDSLSQALAAHPRVFSPLYLNLVKAGEVSGALEAVLLRLAQFHEKAQRIRSKVLAALCYPAAVLVVALGVVAALIVFVMPTFKEVFDGLLGGAPMPAFTTFVLNLSELAKDHALGVLTAGVATGLVLAASLRTRAGRNLFDRMKMRMPAVGEVFRKVAVARIARTLGTLLGSGVPVLQALSLVKDTAGNVVIGRVIDRVHERVKQGDPIAPTLQASGVFPPLVAGMVDVGEQTGALPEMLLKIADTYDDEVDNAVAAMTSLLEPLLIVFLAIIVGTIVIALFLPLVRIPGMI